MPAPLQVLVMPGLAFDSAGPRGGRARGYYDKLLTRILARAASRGWPPPLLGALLMRVHRPALSSQAARNAPVSITHAEPRAGCGATACAVVHIILSLD